MATKQDTPSKRIDHSIDSLNALWGLDLPRLTEIKTDETSKLDKTEALAQKCSTRIQRLCFKTNNTHDLVHDFNEKARPMRYAWKFKPSQESGTIPFPQTKSQSESERVFQPSDEQRDQLLQVLLAELDEAYLKSISASYKTERASDSTASFITAPTTAPTTPPRQTRSRRQETYPTASRNVLSISGTVRKEREEPQLKNPATKSTKRTLGSPHGVSNNPHLNSLCTYLWEQGNKRRQTTLSQFVAPPAPQPSTPPPAAALPHQLSFDTVQSPALSAVFSNADDDDLPIGSNDTSILSAPADATQDLFPTQDAEMFLEDEGVQQSFHEVFQPLSPFDPTNLAQNTPFKRQALLPPGLPFWYCWEIHRVAPLLGLLPFELNQDIREQCGKDQVDYDEFWTRVKQLCIDKDISVPAKSSIPNWVLTDTRYEDDETNKVIYFTAALGWEDDPVKSGCLFKFRLNPLNLEQSCRFHRKMGADRFVVISAPGYPDHKGRPSKVRQLDKDRMLHQKITNFLASQTHVIAGRRWRFCNVEEVKPKSRAKKQQDLRQIKLTMLAESGYGVDGRPMKLKDLNMACERLYPKITIADFLEWHMPVQPNLASTDLKLFSRIGLGFSRTKPTVELYQHEFLTKHDMPGQPVMDDGCALMSHKLAQAIWAAYGGEGEMPSAVQGRISGAKGLWTVDYQERYADVSERGYWIQVSDSQLKIKPHPQKRPKADASQRTFEVLKYWGQCKEGHLNMQLVTILEDRGIPRSLLSQALESDLESFSESLSNAMKDDRALRLWMQEHGFGSRSFHGTLLGSFPDSKQEQMKELLDSGFHPRDCDKIWSTAGDLLSMHMSDYLERMRIRLPNSTVVFCAPDPCNVLAENEVYLGFSKPVIDPRTGLNELALDNIDILLARNPAYLASDMQLREAAYKRELRHYKDVILFSTRGTTPTASLLSGGDYDGDTVTCIWDPKFVQHFRNADVPPTQSEVQCGLVNESRPLSDIFRLGRPIEVAATDFLSGCLAFNSRSNPLGMCSVEHERLVYSLSQQQHNKKLSHPGAVTLAALAGYLVDRNKQGWHLEDKAWFRIRRVASGQKQLLDPAYKDTHPPRAMSGTYSNVIDFLKFEVAKRLSDRVKKSFADEKSKVAPYDQDLSSYWRDAETVMAQEKQLQKTRAMANSLRSNVVHPPTLSDLLKGVDGLQGQISEVKRIWESRAMPTDVSSSNKESREDKDFDIRVQAVYDAFKAIKPREVQHELCWQYDRERKQMHPAPYWSLLKASCLYASVRGNGPLPLWAWYVAGQELCYLKLLQHKGKVKLMTARMHEISKIDAKFTKSLLEREFDKEVLVEAVDEDMMEDDDDDETVALD